MGFRVKGLNNRTWSVRLFNRVARKTVVQMICSMKSCNITSRSLIIAQLSEIRKKNYSPDLKCAISRIDLCVLFHSSELLLTFWFINHKKIKGKECIHVTIHSSELLLTFWFINHKKIKGKECIHVTSNLYTCDVIIYLHFSCIFVM